MTPIHRSLGSRARRGAAALCLLGAAALSGCENFLETEPRGQLTTASFFETREQAIQATNATYSLLRSWQVHVFSWIGLTDIVSDDATKGSVPADASFLLDLDNLNFDPGNIAFRDTWDGYYQGIYRANTAINNIPAVEMDEQLKARLIGENKFLRAYYYFFLVRAFGGVPLITRALAPSEFTQPRATREAVYAQIEQDLTDAIAALPERSQYATADVGRATRGAARALLGEVYLYQGDFQNAYQQLAAVINSGEYSLYPDYSRLFSQAGENSSESVFEVQAVALEQGGGGSQYSEVQGVRGQPSIGWGFNTPSEDLEMAYEPGDPRLQATILYPWELLPDGSSRVVYLNAAMPNSRYNQKAFASPDTPRGTGNAGTNIRRIRYADVLLMAAEAAYRTGRIAEAQNWLNMVRQRAREGSAVTLGFTPELLDQTIASEVLDLPAATSRVFVRFVDPDSPARAAGLRSFASQRDNDNQPIPVQVLSMDLIQSVNGTPITTLEQYSSAVRGLSAGAQATLGVLRVTQADDGAVTTTPMTITVPVLALLPPVTATGQALLDAIWHERRVELAMEQHRWFDIIRQGRAARVMAQVGKNFREGVHEVYPIPAGEVDIAGLQQNPGY